MLWAFDSACTDSLYIMYSYLFVCLNCLSLFVCLSLTPTMYEFHLNKNNKKSDHYTFNNSDGTVPREKLQ